MAISTLCARRVITPSKVFGLTALPQGCISPGNLGRAPFLVGTNETDFPRNPPDRADVRNPPRLPAPARPGDGPRAPRDPRPVARRDVSGDPPRREPGHDPAGRPRPLGRQPRSP